MLESCGMISYSQDAYRSEHDGNDLLVRLIQFVQESWNRGETVVVFISDFQGFFESVWRPLLVIKLQRAGVTGNMLKLINHYLLNRMIRFDINTVTTD